MNSLVYGTNVVGIEGAYDAVNRLCSEIAGKYGWGFVNVNLRPYYAEGSKTVGYEVMEQLGWRIPRHTVVCMASGSLLTKIDKSYKEFTQLGFVEKSPFVIHGPSDGVQPDLSGTKGGDGSDSACAASQNHRQVAGDWNAGGWILCREVHEPDWGLGRGCDG